jgi:hypothetical protein
MRHVIDETGRPSDGGKDKGLRESIKSDIDANVFGDAGSTLLLCAYFSCAY